MNEYLCIKHELATTVNSDLLSRLSQGCHKVVATLGDYK